MEEIQLKQLEEELYKGKRLFAFSRFSRCLPEDLWRETLAEKTLDVQGLSNQISNTTFSFKNG